MPRAEAIAIRGERILAIGRTQEVEMRRGPETRIVNLDGRTLLPGLIDPHMHFVFVLFDDWIDVGPITMPNNDAVQTKLRDAVHAAKPGDWIRAQQFDPSITQGARAPTLAELNALVPDNPFFMLESNGHVAYVNTKALQVAGVTRDTPDPPTARFVRGPSGELTGRIRRICGILAIYGQDAAAIGSRNAHAHPQVIRSRRGGWLYGVARLRNWLIRGNTRLGAAEIRHAG